MMSLPTRRGFVVLCSTARQVSNNEIVGCRSYSKEVVEKERPQVSYFNVEIDQSRPERCTGTDVSETGTRHESCELGVDQQSIHDKPSQETKRRESLSLPTIHLPSKLQKAVDTLLSRYSRKSLVNDGESLSRYLVTRKSPSGFTKTNHRDESHQECGKTKSPFQTTLRYRRREGIAYTAGRIQASYGVTLRVLSEIARRTKMSFKPETLLDFGSGLGTVVWAANQLWGDTIYEYQCVDISQEMGDLARTLRTGGVEETEVDVNSNHTEIKDSIPGTYFKQFLPPSNRTKYDIVVSAYTMGELPSLRLKKQSVASLWRKTKEFLVLIEPGNWSGFQSILEARDMIINESKTWTKYKDETSEELEGHVFAPCPHDLPCPLSPSLDQKPQRPCHFAQRVQLAFSEKNGPLRHKGFHIENFSYIILRKGVRDSECFPKARILQPTKKRTRHVICKLCMSNGDAREVILTKGKHREEYRKARDSEWGDLMTCSESETKTENDCT